MLTPRFLVGLAALLLTGAPLHAQSIKIGVLSDLSSMFTDVTGKGSVQGARMAVEDFGSTLLGRPIEIVSADHQNKPEVAIGIARRWYEQDGVEVIVDLPNSSVALAVQGISRDEKKIVLQTAAGVEDLSGKLCTPYSFQWTWDSYSQAKVIATTLPKLSPDTWFNVAADYSFGITLENNLARFIREEGGTVVGSARHPINTADLSSFLLQAQASRANTIVLASGGTDGVTSIKQAAEFGIGQASGQRLVAAAAFIMDIHAAGLQAAQGIYLPEAFYWDRDDATRAFAKRFEATMGRVPNDFHVAVYSAVLHWLQAVRDAGTLEADAVAAKMRENPVNDAFAQGAHIRADGKLVHDVMMMQVKTPAESHSEYDLFKIVKIVPGDQIVRPLAESECPLVHRD